MITSLLLRNTALASAPLALGLWMGLAGRRLRQSNCARILTFHGTPRERAREYERQFRYLRRQFQVVPLRTLVDGVGGGGPGLARRLVLTFDDGCRSNVEVIYPILKRLGLTATFFVCPGLIDSRRWLWNVEARQRLNAISDGLIDEICRELGAPGGTEPLIRWMKSLDLQSRNDVERRIREASPHYSPSAAQREDADLADWQELRNLDPAVITIGSHTLSHPILSRLSGPELEAEVGMSRRALEDKLERPVELFAYPNGDLDEGVRECVSRHYRGAVTTRQQWVRSGIDPLLLPRLDAPRGAVRLCWNLHREASPDS